MINRCGQQCCCILTYALRRVFLFALPAMVRSAPFAIQILCVAKDRRYVPRPT
jgi:hypothetical protein